MPAEKKELCADIFSTQLYVAPEFRKDPNAESESNENVSSSKMPNENESDSSSKMPIEKYITDGLKTEEFPLTVQKLRLYSDEGDEDFSENDEIVFHCVGQNFEERTFLSILEAHISSVFQTGWWNVNILRRVPDNPFVVPLYYMNASPEYVGLEQQALEEQYMNTRRTISK